MDRLANGAAGLGVVPTVGEAAAARELSDVGERLGHAGSVGQRRASHARSDFKLKWDASTAGDTFVDATWAYTAP